MECTIRPAREDDADEISAVILRTLRETNSKDYAREIIERIERSFSPNAVLQLIGRRTIFVAGIGSRIVGTASLDGSVIRTVFVSPDVQARGIGKLLMAEVERKARERNIARLAVPSSLSAETFYVQLGFRAVRDSYYGQEAHDHHGAVIGGRSVGLVRVKSGPDGLEIRLRFIPGSGLKSGTA